MRTTNKNFMARLEKIGDKGEETFYEIVKELKRVYVDGGNPPLCCSIPLTNSPADDRRVFAFGDSKIGYVLLFGSKEDITSVFGSKKLREVLIAAFHLVWFYRLGHKDGEIDGAAWETVKRGLEGGQPPCES